MLVQKLIWITYVGLIKVLKANYGRTDCKTCASGKPSDQLSNTHCLAQSSLSTVSSRCDGTQSCTVPAVNSVFSDPCFGTYKYLNVTYDCVQPSADTKTKKTVTCEGESAGLKCDVGLIKVLKANYGRTDCKTCASGKPADQLSNTRCLAQSSLSTVSAWCDGTKSCTVPAVNSVFSDPCIGTYKYLDVSYDCVKSSAEPKTNTKTMVTCEGESAGLKCDVGFIKVLKANYGRTDRKTCASGKPAEQLSNTHCLAQSSLCTMSSRCDGTQSCTVPAVNSVFSDPCFGTYKYLNVSYDCVKSSYGKNNILIVPYYSEQAVGKLSSLSWCCRNRGIQCLDSVSPVTLKSVSAGETLAGGRVQVFELAQQVSRYQGSSELILLLLRLQRISGNGQVKVSQFSLEHVKFIFYVVQELGPSFNPRSGHIQVTFMGGCGPGRSWLQPDLCDHTSGLSHLPLLRSHRCPVAFGSGAASVQHPG
ncbi:Rhamnose-binding lectin [Anabarilius grahami]|uniref:Rhamnose-binding lectin n=1 Tax=Anabarilius grahami TaxID=495550 RepID=A0A3N0Y910_ANAGA|nr:Rhamnose-binding lectin [Anabarilius grahami]